MFFITGLPRSGTAWWANFLTAGSVTCIHDFFRNSEVADLGRFESEQGGAVGISDPMALSYQDELIRLFPSAKWLVIQRAFGDVEASCKRQMPGEDVSILHYLSEKSSELIGKLDGSRVMVVPFDCISDKAAVLSIARWLGTDDTFDVPARWNFLNRMNVQVHTEKALVEVENLSKEHACAIRAGMEPTALSKANWAYLAEVDALCGTNRDAWMWINSALETALIWDHIVDGDPCNPSHADRVFTQLTTEWPLNPFFVKFAPQLVPVMVNARSAWRHSNQPSSPKARAYDLYTEIPSTIAWILGGNELVNQVMPRIRDLVSAILDEDEKKDGGKK